MTTIRLTRAVYNQATSQLHEQHPFALERVGFMFARFAPAGSADLILVTHFQPVPDADYVADDRVGARINSEAIRRTMQRALTTGDVVLHVHVHQHRGRPEFSGTDNREMARLVPSFARVAPSVPHGALVFSQDEAAAIIRSNAGTFERASVAVIGFPLTIWSI